MIELGEIDCNEMSPEDHIGMAEGYLNLVGDTVAHVTRHGVALAQDSFTYTLRMAELHVSIAREKRNA